MGIEPNSNRTYRTRTLFWGSANRTERTQRDQLTEPNWTEPQLCGKGSIPMAVKNSQIWIMTHPFIKLTMFFSVCFT